MSQRMTTAVVMIVVVSLLATFWYSPLVYPFKMLTVVFHEASHALMTLLTGGRVVEIGLSPRQGGHVLSVGGNRFLILSAGYLGSLAWGCLIFWFGHHSKHDRIMVRALGIMCLALLLLGPTIAAAVILLALGVALLFIGFKANAFFNDLCLRVIGLTTAIYVPLDILSDTLVRSHLRSDARMLAEEFGGLTIMWGGVWLVLSIFVLGWMLRMLWRDA